LCPSTALVRDPAEVLPKAVYELGVSALNLVHVFGVTRCVVKSDTLYVFGVTRCVVKSDTLYVFGVKRCVVKSDTLFRTERNSV
jgi:hypothetical protein